MAQKIGNPKKLSPFVMNVTPEQSKIAQEYLLSRGVLWSDDTSGLHGIHHGQLMLVFKEVSPGMETLVMMLDTHFSQHLPRLSFGEFSKRYLTKDYSGYELMMKDFEYRKDVLPRIDSIMLLMCAGQAN